MRGVLSVLLVALGRPIRRGCWIEPMMQATNALVGVERAERAARKDHGDDAGRRQTFA
jgi:hypothetical protein